MFYIIARIVVICPVTIGVPVNFISFKASLAVLFEKCESCNKRKSVAENKMLLSDGVAS